LGAARAGALLGVYMAAWAYAEAAAFAVAVGLLGLEGRLSAGLLGMAGLAAGGLGMLALTRAPRRAGLLLAPLPAAGFLAWLATSSPAPLAWAYPVMALSVGLAGAALLGGLLDSAPAWQWRGLVAVFKASAAAARGLALAAMLAAGAPEAALLAALAGVPLVYAAGAPRLAPVPQRRLEELSRLLDDLARALSGAPPRRVSTGLLAAASLAGLGLAAGARFQLTPQLAGLAHTSRLAVLAAHTGLYALGTLAAAGLGRLWATLAAGASAALAASALGGPWAFAAVGLPLGYSEATLALAALEARPSRAASLSGLSLLAASLGVVVCSASPTPLHALAALAPASLAAAKLASRRGPRVH